MTPDASLDVPALTQLLTKYRAFARVKSGL